MSHDLPTHDNSAAPGEPAALHAASRIFRPDALRKYTERHAQAVLPQDPVSTWAIAALWMAIALAAAGGIFAWLAATASFPGVMPC